MNNVHNQRKKKKAKKTAEKKKDEPKKADAKKPETKESILAAAKSAFGGFPKIVTEAKIQTVSYDANTGSNLKFKDLSLTSGQFEKLVAIAQDGHARVRISIEEINPKFDAAAAKGTSGSEPKFTDLSDKKSAKKTNKKANKKTEAKKGKDDTDDGSELPI